MRKFYADKNRLEIIQKTNKMNYYKKRIKNKNY